MMFKITDSINWSKIGAILQDCGHICGVGGQGEPLLVDMSAKMSAHPMAVRFCRTPRHRLGRRTPLLPKNTNRVNAVLFGGRPTRVAPLFPVGDVVIRSGI